MKILAIAPIPPPISGHSLASRVFIDSLSPRHQVVVVNLGIASENDGSLSLRRIVEVLKVLKQVWVGRRGAQVVYLTVSESVAGNIKDLAIFALCARELPRMYLHLHGGSLKKLLFDRHPVLRRINAAFIRRMGGVIIVGPSHERIFADMVDAARIHIVPNFAQDHLFLTERAVADKFAATIPLRVVYISGMTEGKGYRYLLEAYESLPVEVQRRLRIDFAGRFDSDAERAAFCTRIAKSEGIEYHGVVENDQKQRLFGRAHVFCLPTSMFEGQPISILEAYAAGCAVLTTGQEGILDVFTPGLNGFEIQPRSPESIAGVLEAIRDARDELIAMATRNREFAEREFRTAQFNNRLRTIIDGR